MNRNQVLVLTLPCQVMIREFVFILDVVNVCSDDDVLNLYGWYRLFLIVLLLDDESWIIHNKIYYFFQSA